MSASIFIAETTQPKPVFDQMKPILQDLQTENNYAFGKLYQDNFPKIKHFVENNSGTAADAEDLFQDAMIVLVEKLRNDHFMLTASINTYVYAICKNLWFKKLRNKNFTVTTDQLNQQSFFEEMEHAIEQEKTYLDKLRGYMTKITDHCNRLIHDMFFKNKKVAEIKREYGYSTTHNVSNQKYKCIQQIKKVKAQEENL